MNQKGIFTTNVTHTKGIGLSKSLPADMAVFRQIRSLTQYLSIEHLIENVF